MTVPLYDKALLESLRRARRVVVMTGAGVSAESRIPTFRDAMTGLWARYRPEDLATPRAFARNPKLVWDWYQWRRQLVSDAEPNPGHRALAEMESLFDEMTLITQNVDGLHARAGSSRPLELHGNIHRVKCSYEHRVVDDWSVDGDGPPPCPFCGEHLRPDVVWFGEPLSNRVLEASVAAARDCDVFFSVGTSAVVEPAASLIFYAMNTGAITVEINPQPTAQAGMVTHAIAGKSGEVLPRLLAELKG